MKHLPPETVIQILGHLSKPDLMSVALVASRYSTLAQPFLFQRIRLLFGASVLPDGVRQIAKSPYHALMIKTIEIGQRWSESFLEDVRNLVQAAVTLEELSILAPNKTISLELLDPAIFPNLRKLAMTGDSAYAWLAARSFPRCPKLVDLEVPQLSEQWAWNTRFTSVLEQYAPSFMDRLHRFRGPPYFLLYMSKTGRTLQHFSATIGLTDAWISCISKDLGFREGLLSLHVRVAAGSASSGLIWVESQCITPNIIPSLFPNLRSVAWFRVHHLLPEQQPVSVVTLVYWPAS